MAFAPPTTTESEQDLLAPWEGYSPEIVARLALPPTWTIALFEKAGFEDNRLLCGTGRFLDAAVNAALIENSSTLEEIDWELRVQPQAAPRRNFPGGRTLAQERSAAVRIGLMRREELEEPLPSVEPSSFDEPIALRMADVQLRSSGIRFRDPIGLRPGQSVEVEFRRTAEMHIKSVGPGLAEEWKQEFELLSVGGAVVATREDSWSGRSAVVMFESTPHLEERFLAE